ncbi:DUF1513 domain-containing protein [Falsiruegeria litorea]|nr:DUF1513 domain-containing protein [Falsiruegeria litorea]
MATRRRFLAGLAVSGLIPTTGWADVGAPAFLSAAGGSDGTYCLVGLTDRGEPVFQIPLPARGHAAAAHPNRAEAVAFARRPGRFAIVLDCATGSVLARLDAPKGRHFYGHGAFSADGLLLFTTENAYDAARGVVGIWDTRTYRRQGEFPSGGIGPHDIRLMPDGETLVVANGGIETHPDSGRAKLNLPLMQPNLTYLSAEGEVLEQAELAPEMHMNSIRHLDVRADGLVGFATQWQGSTADSPSVVGLHRRGEAPELLSATLTQARAMDGYGGSVAFYEGGTRIAVSSPRGGLVQLGDVGARVVDSQLNMPDVCGLGVSDGALRASTGTGAFWAATATPTILTQQPVAWDNHLVRVSRG